MSVRILPRPKLDYISADGTVPMCIRVNIDGKSDWIKLGRSMKVTSWDRKRGQVKPGVLNAKSLQRFFDSRKELIREVVDDIERDPMGVLTKDEIQKRYDERMGRGSIRTMCFLQFVDDYIRWEEEHDSRITASTHKNNRYQLRLLVDWWKGQQTSSRKKDLTLPPVLIDKQFLIEFATDMTRKFPNNGSAAWSAHSFMRKYLKRIQAKGIIFNHPYDQRYEDRIIIGTPPAKEMEYFTKEELLELTELFFSERLLEVESIGKLKSGVAKETDYGARLQSTLHHFLLGCYTGLRRSDIERLDKRQHLKGDFIVIQVKKGRSGRRNIVRIPIMKTTKRLIQYVSPRLSMEEEKKFASSGQIFQMNLINPTFENEYIRLIVREFTSIQKERFSFHTSRHTFGVVSLLLGMKIEVVKDILGHSELSTTMRYARVVDELRMSQMMCWDQMVS